MQFISEASVSVRKEKRTSQTEAICAKKSGIKSRQERTYERRYEGASRENIGERKKKERDRKRERQTYREKERERDTYG